MPKVAQSASFDSVTIEHDLNEDEYFHGKKLPPDIRWKIFKVKRRANTNYYKLTDDSKDDSRFKFAFNNSVRESEYSYNWPYDYFSLVEMAKIDASIKVSDEQVFEIKKLPENYFDPEVIELPTPPAPPQPVVTAPVFEIFKDEPFYNPLNDMSYNVPQAAKDKVYNFTNATSNNGKTPTGGFTLGNAANASSNMSGNNYTATATKLRDEIFDIRTRKNIWKKLREYGLFKPDFKYPKAGVNIEASDMLEHLKLDRLAELISESIFSIYDFGWRVRDTYGYNATYTYHPSYKKYGKLKNVITQSQLDDMASYSQRVVALPPPRPTKEELEKLKLYESTGG